MKMLKCGECCQPFLALEPNEPHCHDCVVKFLQAECDHDWQEHPGEPPFDICHKCGLIQE